MTDRAKDSIPIPGLEAAGHGIYLRPRQPYELRRLLYKQENYRPCTLKDASGNYCVPEGYEINDSPPMPANQLLNQITVEESWERFDKQVNLDVNLSIGYSAFSINAGVSQMSQLRSEEQSYYAVRSSFIPLWSVYIPDTTNFDQEINNFELPIPFKHAHRKIYDKFFNRFGSHFVRRVWVGGKALLFFTVAKSSNMTKEEIQAGLQASYGGIGGGVKGGREKSREKLQNNSRCSVSGRGGDELKLAALSTLDEARYNEWLATIRDNPQTIEMEVVGIWTLMEDKARAEALNEAYWEANIFTPLTAAFDIDKKLYLMKGSKYFIYDIEKEVSVKPRSVLEQWPDLANVGFDRVDAAFKFAGQIKAESEIAARKIFFFYEDKYVRVDVDTNKVDEGYPKRIDEGWPGVVFHRIDATLEVEPYYIYFFSGSYYIRFNIAKNCADAGYPQLISKRWVGVTFDRIDAAIYWKNGKAYFFRGDQLIRYDAVTFRTDPGYPKYITSNYVEDWQYFDSDL